MIGVFSEVEGKKGENVVLLKKSTVAGVMEITRGSKDVEVDATSAATSACEFMGLLSTRPTLRCFRDGWLTGGQKHLIAREKIGN